MYFPTLNTLKTYHRIDSFIVQKLDSWLGTRRQAVRKFLNPIQFSIDTDIDEDFSILLFANCTNPNIGVLMQRYVVECSCCNRLIGVYSSPSLVPHNAYCIECNENIHISFNDITIWFELVKIPERLPEQLDMVNLPPAGDASGKAEGLRPSRLQQLPMARRLLEGFDERIRSS